jgi:uncharacterized membrane protein
MVFKSAAWNQAMEMKLMKGCMDVYIYIMYAYMHKLIENPVQHIEKVERMMAVVVALFLIGPHPLVVVWKKQVCRREP